MPIKPVNPEPNPGPLCRQDLENTECINPNCPGEHPVIFVHSSCHPGQGVNVGWDRLRAVVRVECFVCGNLVCEIAPAEATVQ